MSTIINTSGAIDPEAQTKAATRPVPELQPTRIVQVPESAASTTAQSSLENGPEQITKLGKKTLSKREHAEQLALKEQTELQRRISHIPTMDLPPVSEEERNSKAKIPSNYLVNSVNYPEEWDNYQKVSRAWLQTPVSVSGVYSSETTFTPDKLQGLLMALTDTGLLARYRGIEIFIPHANVKCCVLKEKL